MSECEECPNIRQLLKIYIKDIIRRFIHPIKQRYADWICNRKGHQFIDKRTFEVKRFKKSYIQQRCRRCRLSRIVDAETREIADSGDVYGLLVWEAVETSADIYSLVPKIDVVLKEE